MEIICNIFSFFLSEYKKKQNASTTTVIQIHISSFPFWISKNPELQNIPFRSPLPSFAHHPISSRTTRYGRSIIPDRYIGQLFSSRIPPSHSHSHSSCRGRAAHARIDWQRRPSGVAQHKSNENQQRPSRVWIMGREFFSPTSSSTRCYPTAIMSESRGEGRFPLPSFLQRCFTMQTRKDFVTRRTNHGREREGRGRDFEREVAFPHPFIFARFLYLRH